MPCPSPFVVANGRNNPKAIVGRHPRSLVDDIHHHAERLVRAPRIRPRADASIALSADAPRIEGSRIATPALPPSSDNSTAVPVICPVFPRRPVTAQWLDQRMAPLLPIRLQRSQPRDFAHRGAHRRQHVALELGLSADLGIHEQHRKLTGNIFAWMTKANR
jgi:hypothetical protein